MMGGRLNMLYNSECRVEIVKSSLDILKCTSYVGSSYVRESQYKNSIKPIYPTYHPNAQ